LRNFRSGEGDPHGAAECSFDPFTDVDHGIYEAKDR
jgi:hypothetical protein